MKVGAEGVSGCVNADVDASAAEGICNDTVAIAVTNGCGGVTECDPGVELKPLFGVGMGNCWRCCCCCGCGC